MIYLAALGFVLLVGFSVRFFAIAGSNFPVNDGGMFYQAISQIQADHFRLPAELHYNGLSIPFAYPPLAFYIAGLISSATGASLIQLLRILPLTFSMATIVAFMAFAHEYLRNRTAVVVASLAFALVPRSHNWEIMGGGLTRGLAFCFAILTLWQAYVLYTRRSRTSLVLTAIFGAITCLSHIEMAWFVAFSAAFFFLALGRSRIALRDSVFVGAGVLVLTSPWWGLILIRDGLNAFINAGQSGANSLQNIFGLLLLLNWGDEPWFPLFGALAALGIILSLRRGKTFLPLWVLVAMVLDTRKFGTDATVPLSLLVAIAVTQFLIPLMSETSDRWFPGESQTRATGRMMQWMSPIVIALMLGYGWLSALGASSGSFTSLSQNERTAMTWVKSNTPNDARFAILTGDIWARDRSSEWFPALTDRVSVATVQGYEWVPNGGFEKQSNLYNALQKCSTETPTCLADWSQTNAVRYDYLYVARRDSQHGLVDYHMPCCSGLVALLESDPSYKLVYQNDDATIFRFVGPTATVGQ